MYSNPKEFRHKEVCDVWKYLENKPLAVGSDCYHTLIQVLVINVKDVAMCVERDNGRIKIYSLLFIQVNVQQASLCIVTIEI